MIHPARIEELYFSKKAQMMLRPEKFKNVVLNTKVVASFTVCVFVCFFTTKVCTNLSRHPVLKRCAHKDGCT